MSGMRGDRRGRRRRPAAAAVVACLLVAGVWTAAPLLDKTGLPVAADRAQLIGGFALPCVLAVVGMWGWVRQPATPATPQGPVSTSVASAGVDRAAVVLAERVEWQWRREALRWSLDDPDPIPVRWRSRPDRSDHLLNIYSPARPGEPVPADLLEWEVSSGDVAGLVERFRGTRRRRLVLVGRPGSGKTTLTVQLVLHLLQNAVAGEPVPVLLPIADWNTETFPELHDWLTERIRRDYPALRSPEIPPTAVRTLVAGGSILPVLDGLDELPPAAQSAVIVALNRSLGDQDQLILTSRTTEYRAATETANDVITSALVLQARPLSPQTAAGYLRTCLPPSLTARPEQPWSQILTGLNSAPPPGTTPNGAEDRWTVLAAITATPLGLWLLRTVYTSTDGDPTDLTDLDRFPDHSTIQTHLLDQLIPTLIKARPPSTDPNQPFRPRRQRDPDTTRRYLSYLADLLTHPRTPDGQPRTRDLVWWQIARHTATTSRTPADEEPGFADLHLRARGQLLLAELKNWLWGTLALGLLFGLFLAVGSGLPLGSPTGFGSEAAYGFTPGHIPGPIAVLARLSVGSMVALLLGLTVGLTRWIETPVSAEQASTPLGSWQADRTLNLARIIIYGLMFGLIFSLLFGLAVEFRVGVDLGLVAELRSGIIAGLVAGIVAGIIFGIMSGGHRAWLMYVVATTRLARRRLLPRNLMGFLDDCHRLGLLRAVGPIYQFRHAELQDHLASTCSEASGDG